MTSVTMRHGGGGGGGTGACTRGQEEREGLSAGLQTGPRRDQENMMWWVLWAKDSCLR